VGKFVKEKEQREESEGRRAKGGELRVKNASAGGKQGGRE